MDLIYLTNSSAITIEPNQTSYLLKNLIQFGIPAFVGLVIGIIGAFFTTKKTFEYNSKLEAQKNDYVDKLEKQKNEYAHDLEKLKNNFAENQRAQDAHSQLIQKREDNYVKLVGLKSPILQSNANYCDAYTRATYYSEYFKLLASNEIKKGRKPEDIETRLKNSTDFQQYMNAMQRSFDLAAERSKILQTQWEIIGSITITFPKTEKLKELIGELEKHKENIIRSFHLQKGS